MLISGLWLENLDDVFQSLVFPVVPERDYGARLAIVWP